LQHARRRKPIVGEAERLACGAIVLGADAPRNRLLADLMWSRSRTVSGGEGQIPVYLVTQAE
jgi:hypothetical protein